MAYCCIILVSKILPDNSLFETVVSPNTLFALFSIMILTSSECSIEVQSHTINSKVAAYIGIPSTLKLIPNNRVALHKKY